MQQPGSVIIKKVKKGGHGGHHGGAWKVAYADFVTAMMAFFLLMWLLNATSEDQKRGIADYFSPVEGVLKSPSGGIGFLGGQAAADKGSLNSATSPPSVSVSLNPPSAESDSDETGGVKSTETGGSAREISKEAVNKLVAEHEAEQFAKAEEQLRQAIQDIPDLKNFAEHLMIDQTPEGLRIQVVDQEKKSMFPSGSAAMYPHTRKLLAVIAEIVFRMPQNIAITGHTDSSAFQNASGYGNWELSADRANASRRALLDAGLPTKRISSVAGRADQELLTPADPTSPRNRRISIVLLRKNPTQPQQTDY